MAMSTLRVASGRSNAWPSRTWWQISKCSPCTRGALAGGGCCAAIRVESMGQPEATEPTTTNLMKSRRELAIALLRSFEKILWLGTEAARAHAVPDDDQRYRNREDQRGDGVDFGSYAAAQASPNFERKSIVTADQKKGHGNFVHG